MCKLIDLGTIDFLRDFWSTMSKTKLLWYFKIPSLPLLSYTSRKIKISSENMVAENITMFLQKLFYSNVIILSKAVVWSQSTHTNTPQMHLWSNLSITCFFLFYFPGKPTYPSSSTLDQIWLHHLVYSAEQVRRKDWKSGGQVVMWWA